MRVLMVDNYDSFTYNLVQYLGELGADLEVVRNDVSTVDELLTNHYDRVVVSPGPCTPNEAGISVEAMRRFPEAGVKTLGVCLGHQSMGQAFGGKVIRHLPVHGKTTEITHNGEGIFAGLPDPLPVARYHSLVVHDDLPDELEATAHGGGVLMAMRHKTLPAIGVQFHPESVLTPNGKQLLKNFLADAYKVLTQALDALMSRHDLSAEQTAAVLAEIMAGNASEVETSGILVALRTKGETIDEIVGLATTMRAFATPVITGRDDLIDTAGTGGGRPTFNVSTTAALIAAGHGCAVAKHGNRSATGLSGSADVLEALGVRIDLKPDAVARCINEVGFGFMFAPAHHGATRFVVPVRKELAVRTIFNFLGPLTNPAGAQRQVIGVSDPNFLETIAGALARLGAKKALVVSSADGLDEMSTSGTTHVVEVDGEQVRSYDVSPEDVGLERAEPAALTGGTPDVNAQTTRQIFAGERGPARDVAVLNAGAAIYVSGTVDSLEEGVRAAEATIDDGRATKALEALTNLTRELAPA